MRLLVSICAAYFFLSIGQLSANTLSQDPIQQIQYVGGVACKQYNCQQRTASLVGIAVFHQECGARPNCNGHAAAYKGSYALSEEQFNRGIAAYLPIARQYDPVLFEVLQAETRRLPGSLGRGSHMLSAAAWYGNNARFLNPIERATSDSYRQAALGMLLQLMPSQTHRALLSADPSSVFSMQLSCASRGAVWALSVNKVPVQCGSTGADAVNLMVRGYPALQRGVAVALGTRPPLPGSLTSSFASSGFGTLATNVFNPDGSINQQAYQSTLNQYASQPGSWDTAQPGSWNGQQSSPQQTPQQSQPQQQSPQLMSGASQYQDQPNTQTYNAQNGFFNVTDRAVADAESYATIECGETSVSWSCTGSSTSRALSAPHDAKFSTRGSLIGTSLVSAKKKTVYTVQCLRNQRIIDQATCEYTPRIMGKKLPRNIAAPVLSLRIEPNVVSRGETAFIDWSAVRVESCELRARGFKEEGVEGSIETPPLALRGVHTFTLSCITDSGARAIKEVELTVE
jgi:hypothetical protein